MSVAPLDNPVYAALTTVHAGFALRSGRVLRYPAEVAPFLGLPPGAGEADWAAAAALVPPGGQVAVTYPAESIPAEWQMLMRFDVVQMTAEAAAGAVEPDAVELGAGDVPEILALVEETKPGPFMQRTIELGRYIGIRRDGELIAMAGERMRFEGWTEISAVCTTPSYRGRGLASRLIGAIVAGIHERSERPFLHAVVSNAGAIRIYEGLGFTVRSRGTISVIAPG